MSNEGEVILPDELLDGLLLKVTPEIGEGALGT